MAVRRSSPDPGSKGRPSDRRPGRRLPEYPAPVAGAIRQVFADAVERGLGDHDWSDLVVAAEARTGLTLTLGPAPDGGEAAS